MTKHSTDQRLKKSHFGNRNYLGNTLTPGEPSGLGCLEFVGDFLGVTEDGAFVWTDTERPPRIFGP